MKRGEDAVAVVECAEDIERFAQMAAGGIHVACRQLVYAELPEAVAYRTLVTGLAAEPQRPGGRAGCARPALPAQDAVPSVAPQR